MSTSLRRLAGVLCVLLTPLVMASPSAQAAGRPFLFGQPGKSSLESSCGLAVDSAGDLYLSNYYPQQQAINVYFHDLMLEPMEQSAFIPLAQLASSERENAPCGLAVDSSGDVYANNFHQAVVKYDASIYPFSPLTRPSYGPPTTIDPGRATGIAVDAAASRLYVTHRTYIAAYQIDGSPVLSGGEPLRIGLGNLNDAYGLAVSGYPATDGYLYVADATGNAVKVFDPAVDPVNPVRVITGSATPQAGFHDLTDAALAVDDSNGHVFVVDNLQRGLVDHPAAVVDEFSAVGAYRGQLSRAIEAGEPNGIAVDNSDGALAGRVYVTSGNGRGTLIDVFGPADPAVTRSLLVSLAGPGTVTSEPAGIVCGSACVGEFGAETAVTLRAAADGHSIFKGWSVSGQPDACPGLGSCQIFLSTDTEVAAEFEALPQHTLSVMKTGNGEGTLSSEPAGIVCGSACVGEFGAETVVTLTAAPRPHSAFRGWSVSGQPGACSGVGACEVTLDADTEISGEFEALPEEELSVLKTGRGRGAIFSDPVGIACGGFCSAGFDRGAVVTLIPEAAPGSVFAGWSGGGCPASGPCRVTLERATQVSANFAPRELPTPPLAGRATRVLAISVTGAGFGTITSDPAGIECGGPCAASYPPGTRVTLTAEAGSESRFTGWSGCESVAANRCSVTLDSTKTVGASFAEAAPVRLGALTVKGARARLEVSLPGAGTLSASGRRLRPARVTTKRPASIALPLSLGRAGKKILARKRRLAVRVKLAFRPSEAGAASVLLTRTVTFKKRSRR